MNWMINYKNNYKQSSNYLEGSQLPMLATMSSVTIGITAATVCPIDGTQK